MGVRKNYRTLTDIERARFVEALYHVKSTGLVDELANMHAAHFSHGIHRSSHFLPWHREFVSQFENALQQHHPDITIPYWDSTVDRSPSDPLWDDAFVGQFDSAWGLGRALGSAVLPTAQQLQTNQERGTYDAFWPELELVIHNPPHRWVGGIMAQASSPADPIFFLHHCWIDLLWAQWQLANPAAPFVSSGARFGQNDALMEWPNRTPADVLDHHALSYTYDFEQPSLFVGLQMILDRVGQVWAKDSIGNGGWTQETPAGHAAIAAGGNGLQLILDGVGHVWAKDLIGNAGWTQETPAGHTAIAAGGNGLQMILDGAGQVWAKDSIGNGGWTQETPPGHTAIAAGGNGLQMILDAVGQVWAKDSIGSGGWTQETPPSHTAIASGVNGLQMILDAVGQVWAKDSIGNGGWTQETPPGHTAIAAGED